MFFKKRQRNHKYLLSFSITEEDKVRIWSRVVVLANEIKSEQNIYQLEGILRDSFYNNTEHESDIYTKVGCILQSFSYLGKTDEEVTKFI